MKKQWVKSSMIVGLATILIMGGSLQARGTRSSGPCTQGVWMTELNLNTQQMQKINEMRDGMQPAMMDIRHQIRKYELELNQIKRSATPVQAKVTVLRKSIFDSETAIDAIQTNHRSEVRVLLTAEQQIIFDTNGYGNGSNDGSSRSKRSGTRNGSGDRSGRGRG